MLLQIIRDAWHALLRGRVRSALTMLGIVWGIVTVTLLISYGSGFRNALVNAFNAFGSSAVICWPGQRTSGRSTRRTEGPL
jgi:putative ABC transport system permease protein